MRKALNGPAFALLILVACGNAQPSDDLIRSLERLAASENPEALYHLGMAYQTGTGVGKDSSKALEAFRRAALRGDVLASYKLGCFYAGQEGSLVKADPEVALRHKLIAAEAGYALAQQDVAALYAAQGNLPTAVTWLEKAAAQGWADALATYASVHNGTPGVPPDRAKTAAYFRLFLDRTEGSRKQLSWLEEFEENMSPAERQAAAAIVGAFKAAPTPLTLKALSGQRAALELVARQR
jgi:TPR repeat protein